MQFVQGLIAGGIVAGLGVWFVCADKIQRITDDRDWYQRICAGLEGVNKDLRKTIGKLMEMRDAS